MTGFALKDILIRGINNCASDVHLSVGDVPMLRIDGNLVRIPEAQPLAEDDMRQAVSELLTESQIERFNKEREYDFSFGLDMGVKEQRFRANFSYEKGCPALALRAITSNIRTMKQLGLPDDLKVMTKKNNGLFLVTGPTGSGKSTTLAAIIQEINLTRSVHIVTVEDPIEYLYTSEVALIHQRELGRDTKTFAEALRRAISPRIKDGRVIFDDLKLPVEKMREFTRIFIVACGSSYHVGMIGKYNLEHLLRRNVEVVLASEFRYSDPIVDDKSLVIVISQSGETLDTMAALREAKKRGGYILSIVNVVGSSIARESDDVLYTWAGPEIAVATTKAYSTQLAVLDMIGLAFGEVLGTVKKEEYNEAVAELQKLPATITSRCQRFDFRRISTDDIAGRLEFIAGKEDIDKMAEILEKALD
ncbi:ATPase, T2SS/T4P/T4SS family [Cloacibacillus evryensis]|uniref:ATPase, T2SS/T4P/T4SS family n=1 Tax=Cloacibacillus evryensis TaxID=508460 RepID=UPI00241C43C1|nr:ATPase, T2SS/T4P/T4SS family [Cloacibacillus evryensis]